MATDRVSHSALLLYCNIENPISIEKKAGRQKLGRNDIENGHPNVGWVIAVFDDGLHNRFHIERFYCLGPHIVVYRSAKSGSRPKPTLEAGHCILYITSRRVNTKCS